MFERKVLHVTYTFICKYQNGYLELVGVYVLSGPPREILQGGTRLIWGPGDKLRLLLNGLPSYNVNE